MPATGLARGDRGSPPDPHLAFEAVQAALAKLGAPRARTVLLFLSGHFNRHPTPAIHAAGRAAQTTQIAGCTAVGVYTDEAWTIDRPAAAAMVFGPDEFDQGEDAGRAGADEAAELTPALAPRDDGWLFSLATPSGTGHGKIGDWLAMPGRRIGGIAGDNNGRGPFPVWSSGKLLDSGRLDLHLPAHVQLSVSPGLTPLSALLGVTDVNDFDLVEVGNRPALGALIAQALPHLAPTGQFPWQRLLLARADDEPRLALATGQYELLPVLGVSATRALVVGGRLLEGDRVFSVLREPEVARQELDIRLTASHRAGDPRYVLLMNCAGRGPGFFDGDDADWESVRRRFPGTPMIGFYGNGEIASIGGRNRLLQFASVCAVVD